MTSSRGSSGRMAPLDPGRRWLARVIGGSEPVGLGVIVAPRHLVTCTHVIEDALGLTSGAALAGQDVRVELLAGGRATARVTRGLAVNAEPGDLCLLRLAEDPPHAARWSELVANSPRVGSRVRAYGFPSDVDVRHGLWSINNEVAGEVGNGWWQMNDPANGPRIQRGFSGTVVWDQDEDIGVGLLVARHLGQATTYLIPWHVVGWAFPEIASGEPLITPLPTRAFHVFLAHNPADKPVVREFARLLRNHSLQVALDGVLPGRPWQDEIERALQNTLSLIVAVGPSGLAPWTERQTRALLAEAEADRGLPILTVLLPGAADESALPDWMRQQASIDLRSGFSPEPIARLCLLITDRQLLLDSAPRGVDLEDSRASLPRSDEVPRPRLFGLGEVPLLTAEYLARVQELTLLREAVLSPDVRPVVVVGQRRSGSSGTRGIGKTVLATALARDVDVRRAFPDGVQWVALGQEAGPLLPELQARLAERLGLGHHAFASSIEGTDYLRGALAERAILLILDDVCDPAHAAAFGVLGERSKLLMTTRLPSAGQPEAIERPLGELSRDGALAMLASYAGLGPEALPPEAGEIVRDCGHLPLSLALIGAMLRGRPPIDWRDVLGALRRRPAADPSASAPSAIDVSVSDLPEDLLERYLDLAIFPAAAPVPQAILQTLWAMDGLDHAAVEGVIDALVGRSLVELDGERRLHLHDLLRDHLRERAGAGLVERHRRLLEAYRRRCPDGWHLGPRDGYFFEYLGHHLREAGRDNERRRLLLDYRWMKAKLAAMGLTRLLWDYEREDAPRDGAIRAVSDALRVSAPVLMNDPAELPAQLCRRLSDTREAAIEQFVGEIQSARRWLRPLAPTLDSTAPKRLKTSAPRAVLDGRAQWVHAAAASAGGTTGVTSNDRTLNVWDLRDGTLRATLDGHAGRITAAAVSRDGTTAITGAAAGMLTLWDLRNGAIRRTLGGHGDKVTAVALSEDGWTAASGSCDGSVHIWNLQDGAMRASWKVDATGVMSLAIRGDGATIILCDRKVRVCDSRAGTPLLARAIWADALSADGTTAISFHGGALQRWDLRQGRVRAIVRERSARTNVLALTAEGEMAVSGSASGTVKVWDLRQHAHITSLTVSARITSAAMSRDRVLIGDEFGRVHRLAIERP